MSETILIIDNSAAAAKGLKVLVESLGYIPAILSTADEAIQTLKSNQEKPVLVICDGLDGDWEKVYEVVIPLLIPFLLYTADEGFQSLAEERNIPVMKKGQRNMMEKILSAITPS